VATTIYPVLDKPRNARIFQDKKKIGAQGFAQPTANTADIIPSVYMISGIFWSFVIHANINLRFGSFENLLASPYDLAEAAPAPSPEPLPIQQPLSST
jgi:hypothetical protein